MEPMGRDLGAKVSGVSLVRVASVCRFGSLSMEMHHAVEASGATSSDSS